MAVGAFDAAFTVMVLVIFLVVRDQDAVAAAVSAGRPPAEDLGPVRQSAPTPVIVSAAAVWEIAIKKAVGRLDAPDDLLEVLATSDFQTLEITASHALLAGTLPPHHSDPFDRMMIAQARAENLTLVSVDGRFPRYDVELLPLS